jgi:hypothetical protein
MTTQTKLALSMIAVAASGFAMYMFGLSGDVVKVLLSLVALLVSIVFCVKFMVAGVVTDKNDSEKEILKREQLKLKGKGIK